MSPSSSRAAVRAARNLAGSCADNPAANNWNGFGSRANLESILTHQTGPLIAMGSEGEFYALTDRERAESDSATTKHGGDHKTRRRPPTHG